MTCFQQKNTSASFLQHKQSISLQNFLNWNSKLSFQGRLDPFEIQAHLAKGQKALQCFHLQKPQTLRDCDTCLLLVTTSKAPVTTSVAPVTSSNNKLSRNKLPVQKAL